MATPETFLPFKCSECGEHDTYEVVMWVRAGDLHCDQDPPFDPTHSAYKRPDNIAVTWCPKCGEHTQAEYF